MHVHTPHESMYVIYTCIYFRPPFDVSQKETCEYFEILGLLIGMFMDWHVHGFAVKK